MSIIRVDKKQNFVVMDKTGLEDPNLSFKAKGLLAYLLSKPDNWYCHSKHLAKVGQDGISAVKSGLKELREQGYLEKRKIRDKKGKIKEWESIIREVPKKPSKQEVAQKYENPTTGKPADRKTVPHNKELDLINNDNNNKTEEEDAREKKIPEKISTKFEQVFNRKMSVELYNKLIKIYSDPQILMKALRISEEQADKPKYLLVILKDWKDKNITSVSEINKYQKERQAKKKKNHRRSSTNTSEEHKKLHNVEELKAKGWN